MDELLQQGITAYKAGKRDEARKIFITVVKQSPNSESAWGWMYQVSNNDQERTHCLKQILRINPKSEKAKQLLDTITRNDFPFEPLQTQKNIVTPVAQTEKTTISQKIPNPNQQTNTILAIGAILFVCFLCIFIYFSGSDGNPIGGRIVKYVVTGNTNTSSISYTNETGGDNSIEANLPFQKEITLKDAGFVSILAWPGGSDLTGTITCEVWVNGKLEETTTANNTLVTCGAYVP
ncbi:MAG: hypothetical protein H7Y59_05885 [Anaerolineales bacterium]|nr:hypothetical protein [Anaerolineales bacterium]